MLDWRKKKSMQFIGRKPWWRRNAVNEFKTQAEETRSHRNALTNWSVNMFVDIVSNALLHYWSNSVFVSSLYLFLLLLLSTHFLPLSRNMHGLLLGLRINLLRSVSIKNPCYQITFASESCKCLVEICVWISWRGRSFWFYFSMTQTDGVNVCDSIENQL